MPAQYEIRVRKTGLTIAAAYALAERLADLGMVGTIQRVTWWPRRRVTIEQIGGAR